MKSLRIRSTAARRYALDESNRLIILQPRDALQPRHILDGRLTTDRQNHLIYHVDSSAGSDGDPGPHTFDLDGSWKLTPNHELALTLHDTSRRQRQTLYFKGALVRAGANALVFALRQSEDEALRTARELTLFGRWQADAKNRLNFLVKKAAGSEDRLTLQGGWEVGQHHELLYRYRQRAEGDRGVDERSLIFEGAWDITKAGRLVYRLVGSQDSSFEFKAGLQSPSLLARSGRIVYQVGIGLSQGRLQRQRVTLFGTWKLNRDLSASFEIPYADGRMQAIRFEGAYAPSPRDRIALALHNRQREGLGLTVTFTRDVMPDARLFLRLRQDEQERSAIGGVQVQF